MTIYQVSDVNLGLTQSVERRGESSNAMLSFTPLIPSYSHEQRFFFFF